MQAAFRKMILTGSAPVLPHDPLSRNTVLMAHIVRPRHTSIFLFLKANRDGRVNTLKATPRRIKPDKSKRRSP